MTNSNNRYTATDRERAKQVDLIAFIKKYHHNTITYAPHPNYECTCYRSTIHNSLAFYTKRNKDGSITYRFHRFSTGQDDDAIQYLRQYLCYNFADAISALLSFADHTA